MRAIGSFFIIVGFLVLVVLTFAIALETKRPPVHPTRYIGMGYPI